MKLNRKTLILILLSALGLLAAVYLTRQRQDIRNRAFYADASLVIDPASDSYQTGDIIPVTLRIDSGQEKIITTGIEVEYDPDYLSLTVSDVTNLSIFKKYFQDMVIVDEDNGNKILKFTAYESLTDPSGYPSGLFDLALLNFHAVQATTFQSSADITIAVTPPGTGTTTVSYRAPILLGYHPEERDRTISSAPVNAVYQLTIPPSPTPTPSPMMSVNLQNPSGGAVSAEVCPVQCPSNMTGCTVIGDCKTQSPYDMPKPSVSPGYLPGIRIDTSDLDITEVTPGDVPGYSSLQEPYYYYVWPDWTTGTRTLGLTFIAQTPTPSPTLPVDCFGSCDKDADCTCVNTYCNLTTHLCEIIPTVTGLPSSTPTITSAPVSLTPSATGVPSITPTLTSAPPTPTVTSAYSPTPTPPSGYGDYVIDIRNKDELVVNIGGGGTTPTATPATPTLPPDTPYVRFGVRLFGVENTPEIKVRFNVSDMIIHLTPPPAGSNANFCQTPGWGDNFYKDITMVADDGVYYPKPGASYYHQGNRYEVTPDGWIALPRLNLKTSYALSVKGPLHRNMIMAKSIVLKAGKDPSQNYDWTANLLEPGDLPDPNNNMQQDCKVNMVDMSLIINRHARTDSGNLAIADVDYNGIINAADISKVDHTLQTKPDDDRLVSY